MSKKSYQFFFKLLAIDFNLLNISFFAMNYLKRGTLELSQTYVKLLFAFYLIWLLVSLFTKKFHPNYFKNYRDMIFNLIINALFMVYCASFMVVIMGLPAFSRLHVFGTFWILLFLELILFKIFYNSIANGKAVPFEEVDSTAKAKPKLSVSLLISDFFIITLIFYSINYIKRDTFILPGEYEELLLIMYGIWLLASLITNKFNKGYLENILFAMIACTKAALLMAFTMSVIIFAFRLFYYSRFQIFGTISMLLMFEVPLYYMYFALRKGKDPGRDIESVDEIKTYLKQYELIFEPSREDAGSDSFTPVKEKLFHVLDFFNPWLFDVIDKSIDLSKVCRDYTAISSSDTISEMRNLDNNSLQLFINLHKINDIRWVNRYFLNIYGKLKPGGYFIGNAETIVLHRKRFFARYPKYFAEVFYVISFIYRRVLPKLSPINKIYFAVTKGRSRLISRAEVLGRLYFCGFKVIAEQDDKHRVYFIAQKVKSPSLDQSPSYGPLVRLERSGGNGRPITIYKFRTMYPYSEYLQEYVYNMHSLERGGKFKNDFRVSALGKFMRETWLDELPMLYNWIKGDVQLFGVRPLSAQYLSLYDDKLQALRGKVKPGLIPPFYADLPETFEEIKESEKRYLESYLREPFKTQCSYLWKSFVNIIIKGARSH